MISTLGLLSAAEVNNGMFELRREWLSVIQPHFFHEIALSESDYFIAFDYEVSNE